jgi:hypothetical protein
MTGRLNTWLLLLLAICAVSFWFGKDLVIKGTPESSPDPTPVVSSPDYAMAKDEQPVHLVILNGTVEPGLAREISLLLGRAGCVAERVGNASSDRFTECLLVNRRLSERRAAELGRRLGGIRVIREADGRGSEDAVLVLGADSARLKEALGKIRGS